MTFDAGWGVSTLGELAPFRFATGLIGTLEVMVSRTGYTGELGYELFVHPDDSAALWDVLGEQGLTPLGLKALDRARIEAGLLSPGLEFDTGVSPFEAGIGWAVALGKEDFVGKAACERLAAQPPRIAVGLTLAGNEVAPLGQHVYAPGDSFPAGRITSATFSPILDKSIALAQVFPEYSAVGTALEVGFVDGLARRTDAVAGPLAAYDRKRRRKP